MPVPILPAGLSGILRKDVLKNAISVLKTPYWNETGGLNGKKACVEICPLDAIVFTTILPRSKEGDGGYNVNLRGEEWERLGLSYRSIFQQSEA